MKYSFYILITLIFISCRDEISTDVYIFNNTTNHVIDLTFYEPLEPKNIKEYTSIRIDKKSTNNSIYTTGLGNAQLITYEYDSVLVTYDDTVHTTHPSQYGEPIDYTGNQILNYGSWILIQGTEEENKKHNKRDLIYTFTEQDYENAL